MLESIEHTHSPAVGEVCAVENLTLGVTGAPGVAGLAVGDGRHVEVADTQVVQDKVALRIGLVIQIDSLGRGDHRPAIAKESIELGSIGESVSHSIVIAIEAAIPDERRLESAVAHRIVGAIGGGRSTTDAHSGLVHCLETTRLARLAGAKLDRTSGLLKQGTLNLGWLAGQADVTTDSALKLGLCQSCSAQKGCSRK